MTGGLFMGCGYNINFVTQDLSLAGKIRAGMTTDEVIEIMGEPIISELDRNVEEWHYCRSDNWPPKDRFLAIYFVDDKVISKIFYARQKGKKSKVFGSCEHFVKTGDYKVPPEVQAILDKNTPTPSELKEPKEPIEPEEGVMPIVPKVEIPNQPNKPPKTEEDE